MSAPTGDLGTATPHAVLTATLFTLARGRFGDYLSDLQHLVGIDSGSYTPAGVNQVGDWFAARLARIGFNPERIAMPPAGGRPLGDALLARKPGSRAAAQGGRRILLIGHMDTVFEEGTVAERPFTLEGVHAHGPGVSDDKGGLLSGLAALELLDTLGLDDYAEVVFLATPDEEIGSPGSRPLTEQVAGNVDVALALECARENGDLVIARKGVADFRITVTGRAAHAGIEPERGANAALAAAQLVVALHELNGRWDGVSVNVGVIRAGTRTNIVCSEAEIHLEVRATTARGLEQATAAIRHVCLNVAVEGTSAQCDQLDWCPPLEDTPAAREVLAVYQACAAHLDLAVTAAATGGVGDANFVGGLGIATLDGLGPVGGGDHSLQEWLDTSTVTSRVALLAATIAHLGHTSAPPPTR